MQHVLRAGVAAFLLAFAPGVVLADTAPVPPVSAYAQIEGISDPSFSSDGTHLAFMAAVNGRRSLAIKNLASADKPAVVSFSDANILGYEWVNEERLILFISVTKKIQGPSRKIPVRFTRIVAVNRDGSNLKPLLDRSASKWTMIGGANVLTFLDRENVLVAYPSSNNDTGVPDILKLNVYTGDTTRVMRGKPEVSSYIPDPSGQVRLAGEFDDRTQTQTYYYRSTPDSGFEVLRRSKVGADPAFNILGFTADPNKIYVASTHEGDRQAVYEFDLTTKSFGPKVLEDPTFDVTGAKVDHGKVVAFGWMDDLPRTKWLDPKKQQLQEALDKAVPDSRELIQDQSPDGRYTLVASFSGSEPVAYRLFDSQTKQLAFFADTMPGIPQEALGARSALHYSARDGLSIPAYLTLPPGRAPKNLPFIIMPHGGPFARDSLVFDKLSQFLASRGYAVLQPNFRGSTGYGNSFNKAGIQQWGKAMQDDVTDGVKWAVDQGIADPKRVCIVGWSYGGYAALMGAAKTPDLYRCVISTAPVANLERLYDELAWSGARGLNRGLFLGDGKGLEEISPSDRAADIKAPILLVHGDMDAQAYVEHSRDMADALKKAGRPYEFLEIEGMDHSPSSVAEMEKVLTAWDKFLAQHLGR